MTNERDWYEDQMSMLIEQLTSARKIEDEGLNRSTQARLVHMVADVADRRSLEKSRDDMRLYGSGMELFTMLEDGTLLDALRPQSPDEVNISLLRSLVRINLATARTCPGFDIDGRAHGLLRSITKYPELAVHLKEIAISLASPDKDIVHTRIVTLPGYVASFEHLEMQRVDLIYAALGPALTFELLEQLSETGKPANESLTRLIQELRTRLSRRSQFLPLLAAAVLATEARLAAHAAENPVGREAEMPNLARHYAESVKHFGWAVVLAAKQFGFTEADLESSLEAWVSNWHYNADAW
jgi:hypothetical protein